MQQKFAAWLGVLLVGASLQARADLPLGLPLVPVPDDNPQSATKIELGKKLFNDKRLSMSGTVSCATCHNETKAFTDSPLKTSKGINDLLGTRNAPTIINAAYFPLMFWDGREPSLELQSKDPMVNPVEMGLKDHQPVINLAANDSDYKRLFETAFGLQPAKITMREVQMAIAAFERTLVSGDSPFDRWFFGHEEKALDAKAKRGFKVFTEQGRCVSCHTIEQTQALFSDGRFHNIGVGITQIQRQIPDLPDKFLVAKNSGTDVDKAVLQDKKTSELGRFAVDSRLQSMGAFKTSTLRNIAVTAPYMHDGSFQTLRDVVEHYNNGGITRKTDRINDYLSGGIRPLNLTVEQRDDLVTFLEALTSPQYAAAAVKSKPIQHQLSAAAGAAKTAGVARTTKMESESAGARK